VLLDCDGVLGDFTTPAVEYANRFLGTNHTVDLVNQWEIMEALGIDKETANKVYASMAVPGFCASIPVLPGAQDGVAKLQTISDVYVVTSPFNSTYWVTERDAWLHRHFGIPRSKIAHVSAKYLCVGEVLVDDKAANLTQWAEHHPDGLPIKWEVPFNRTDGWTGASTADWDTLFDMVNNIATRMALRYVPS
jgi:5'(3')-deoxyribonucleotidase